MRNKTLILKVKICLLSTALSLLSLQLVAQHGSEGIESRLRHDIGALAHDSMFGREAGSFSELKAAHFIENSFRQSGLRPYDPATGSYLRPFGFGSIIFGLSKFSLNEVDYKSGVDFGAIAGSASSKASGTVVEYRSDDNNRSSGRDNYRGKVVLVDLRHQKLLNPLGEIPESNILRKVLSDEPVAILVCNAFEDDFKGRLFNVDSISSFPVPVLYVTPEIEKSINKQSGAQCTLEVTLDKKRKTAHNVIGFVDNGSATTVVIGGHFDHVGSPGSANPVIGDPAICNGADDNASGAAAVMELARWASVQKGINYNYLFIAFSAEEKGLFGSWNFCNSSDFRKYDIGWMLNLDMVGRLGWKGKNRVSVQGVATARQWKQLLKTTQPQPETFSLLKIKGAPGFSDHHPFVKHRVPVLYFMTGLEHEYHKPADDASLINYKGEAMLIEYLEQLIVNAEKIPQPVFRRISGWQNAKAFISDMLLKR